MTQWRRMSSPRVHALVAADTSQPDGPVRPPARRLCYLEALGDGQPHAGNATPRIARGFAPRPLLLRAFTTTQGTTSSCYPRGLTARARRSGYRRCIARAVAIG